MSKNIATLIGLSAIIMWASMVGLIKQVSTGISPALGITLIFSCSAVLVFTIFKWPDFKKISKKYLIFSTLLFAVCELCFSFAIALTKTSQQAIEVSIINYLWPSLTIFAFVVFKELKFNLFIILGLILSISGIIFIQTGNNDFSFKSIITNLQSNPVSYILAFLSAITWTTYCVVTKKMSNGHNPISVFFIVLALTLWLKLFLTHEPLIFPHDPMTFLYILCAGCAVGLGYAAWNIGIIHGNIPVLVIASYFTPVISSVIAMFVLQTHLSTIFWQGTAMVTLGSFICWLSTNWESLQLLLKKLRD
ncbi:aromatic amino acid DMT transporter YddG [Acinetobacter sp. S40]|uniref:aromatic amino acid DMT transporter YddG n=1 Tax=Acinetobacter sp. S40 TaxID=2767434 RepID=UPI00190DCE84|nr:aromatic amino acid DMT transporter YddG [Acinetobacter sp. S40]MBJ9984623.1 aromatic amino acid DMT transporter YddG [Acinetobacter sp. S40]